MKFNLQSNQFMSMAQKYSQRLLKEVSVHRKRLLMSISSPFIAGIIKETGRQAGNKPSLHIETGILDRIIKANLGKYVQQLTSPSEDDFQASLLKSEKLLVEDARFHGSMRNLIAAADRVRQNCLFPNERFTPIPIEQAADSQINRAAASGYPHFTKKGIVLDELVAHGKSILADERKFPWYYPMTRAFRLQLRIEDDIVVSKTRVMYPMPGVITLLECIFIAPFIKHFAWMKTFYIIGKNGGQISRQIKEKFQNSPGTITSTDISAFDQSMINEPIILAFSILRNQLQLNQAQAYVFDWIVRYNCCNLMVSRSKDKVPHSFIKLHGISSGSCFTNMIGTLSHAIILEYLNPGITKDSFLCGDDNLFPSHNIDLNALAKGYKDFNLTLHVHKSETFPNWEKIKFLGFIWLKGVRIVNLKLVLNQTLWHASFRTDMTAYDREVARGASVLLNGANGSSIFAKLFPDIMKGIRDGVDVKFNYLYGSQPPTTAPGVADVNLLDEEIRPGPNKSLILHLKHGWFLR
jgi:hypothetical protein